MLNNALYDQPLLSPDIPESKRGKLLQGREKKVSLIVKLDAYN